jgi:protein-tyrosine phosphatase
VRRGGDTLQRLTDIHSHILYGLDDGARDPEQSLAMLQMAAAAGTTDIVATPHCNDEFEFDPARNADRIAELQAAVAPLEIRIHTGCDFHLSLRNVRQALADPTRFTINHHQYLLAEFSEVMIFEGVSNLFDQLLQAGVRPIITHPERNSMLRKKSADLSRWVQQGCFLQVTAQSYLGVFGPEAKESALSWTSKGLVHFVASDAHDLTRRTPRLDQAFAFLEKQYGQDVARSLCIDNPAAVLQGVHLSSADPSAYAEVKPWYKFW